LPPRAGRSTTPVVTSYSRAAPSAPLFGETDVRVAIRRLHAYAEAGADCLYAPGFHKLEDVAALVEAVAPKPVNVLMSTPGGLTVADLAALGVRRISVGSTLARVAWGAFMRAARQIAGEGRFDRFADAVPYPEIDGFFRDDRRRRGA
jgi:2-methylisocitrate lyase-like PEP mutase family enzyme